MDTVLGIPQHGLVPADPRLAIRHYLGTHRFIPLVHITRKASGSDVHTQIDDAGFGLPAESVLPLAGERHGAGTHDRALIVDSRWGGGARLVLWIEISEINEVIVAGGARGRHRPTRDIGIRS